ncbi:hypothetical protein [Chryseobacterium daeguense]|uniref:hypothetical protein n=1 Tax=Chryseobacterium daeguense TaxID=412438 RepID=UPI00040A580D|nr:hypothetical protein [Chryseobacterium daeguense]
MKKIILLLGIFLLASCGNNDKDCNCTQQRYERKAVYTIAIPPQFVSASEWEKKGNAENIDSDDCSKNGSISKKGDADSWVNSGGTTSTVVEYEYRVTCQ